MMMHNRNEKKVMEADDDETAAQQQKQQQTSKAMLLSSPSNKPFQERVHRASSAWCSPTRERFSSRHVYRRSMSAWMKC
jgi:hypothetical protein